GFRPLAPGLTRDLFNFHEGIMTIAIGVVITEHIVSGRLEDQQLVGKLLRYPGSPESTNRPETPDELAAIPAGELVDIIAGHIETLAGSGKTPADAIGVAVPGIVRSGVVEESPNLTQIKGMRLKEKLADALAEH